MPFPLRIHGPMPHGTRHGLAWATRERGGGGLLPSGSVSLKIKVESGGTITTVRVRVKSKKSEVAVEIADCGLWIAD